MCMIIAMSGELESGLVQDGLKKFGTLAETGTVPGGDAPGHKDGWGLVAYHGTKVAFYEKYPVPAAGDLRFENAIKQISALDPSVVIGHLRKASIGGLKLENTHPFVVGNWTFCHNGSIGGKGDAAGLELNQKYLRKRRGETDSEAFFLYLLQLLSGVSDPDSAVTQKKLLETINLIRNTRDYTAMNMILANGKTLLVVREVNEKNDWVKEKNLCDYYYTLFIGKSGDQKTKIICSEKLDLAGISWLEIPNHSIVAIDLPVGEAKTSPI